MSDLRSSRFQRLFQDCAPLLEMGRLQVLQRVASCGEDVTFDVHPEGEDEINDKGRAHREEGDVDEPGPNTGGGYPHSFADCGTHPEHLPLNEVLQLVHASNLYKNGYSPLINCGTERQFFGNFTSKFISIMVFDLDLIKKLYQQLPSKVDAARSLDRKSVV